MKKSTRQAMVGILALALVGATAHAGLLTLARSGLLAAELLWHGYVLYNATPRKPESKTAVRRAGKDVAREKAAGARKADGAARKAAIRTARAEARKALQVFRKRVRLVGAEGIARARAEATDWKAAPGQPGPPRPSSPLQPVLDGLDEAERAALKAYADAERKARKAALEASSVAWKKSYLKVRDRVLALEKEVRELEGNADSKEIDAKVQREHVRLLLQEYRKKGKDRAVRADAIARREAAKYRAKLITQMKVERKLATDKIKAEIARLNARAQAEADAAGSKVYDELEEKAHAEALEAMKSDEKKGEQTRYCKLPEFKDSDFDGLPEFDLDEGGGDKALTEVEPAETVEPLTRKGAAEEEVSNPAGAFGQAGKVTKETRRAPR